MGGGNVWLLKTRTEPDLRRATATYISVVSHKEIKVCVCISASLSNTDGGYKRERERARVCFAGHAVPPGLLERVHLRG